MSGEAEAARLALTLGAEVAAWVGRQIESGHEARARAAVDRLLASPLADSLPIDDVIALARQEAEAREGAAAERLATSVRVSSADAGVARRLAAGRVSAEERDTLSRLAALVDAQLAGRTAIPMPLRLESERPPPVLDPARAEIVVAQPPVRVTISQHDDGETSVVLDRRGGDSIGVRLVRAEAEALLAHVLPLLDASSPPPNPFEGSEP